MSFWKLFDTINNARESAEYDFRQRFYIDFINCSLMYGTKDIDTIIEEAKKAYTFVHQNASP